MANGGPLSAPEATAQELRRRLRQLAGTLRLAIGGLRRLEQRLPIPRGEALETLLETSGQEADRLPPRKVTSSLSRAPWNASSSTASPQLRPLADHLNARLAALPADTPNHLAFTAQTNSALVALADAVAALEGVGE